MRGRRAILVAALLLGGCATVTPYQPQRDGYGYAEQLIEQNRMRVSFAGSPATSRETVENYVLYRAAELTLARGYDYFVLTANQTQAQSGGSVSPTLSFGFGSFGFGSHSSVGVGVGTTTGGGSRHAYTAQAEVLMQRGRKPEGDPQAFDAREVLRNLEGLIQRPSR